MEVAGHGFIPNTMNEMNEEAALPFTQTKVKQKPLGI